MHAKEAWIRCGGMKAVHLQESKDARQTHQDRLAPKGSIQLFMNALSRNTR